MRRQRDAPLRQIEVKRLTHGTVEPGIAPRLRRPHSLDKATENHTVDALQPRLEQAVNAHAYARKPGSPHDAVRDHGAEHIGIVGRLHDEIGVGRMQGDVLEYRLQCHAIGSEQRDRHAAAVRAERGDDIAMTLGDLPERRGAQSFERRERAGQSHEQVAGGIEVRIPEIGTWIGPMQLARFISPQLCEFRPKQGKGLREAGGAGAGTRAAQHRLFKCCNGAGMRALSATQPDQRMLEQAEQADRSKPVERDFRGQAGKHPRGGIGERVATGIVDLDLPAFERGDDAARQGAVGRHKGCGFAGKLHGFAQRNRNGECLLTDIRGFDDRQGFERAVHLWRDMRRREVTPQVGGCRRPQGFRDIAVARMRGGYAESDHLLACNADATKQRLQRELRVPDCGRAEFPASRVAPPPDQLPRGHVEMRVEPGQHDGAVRKLCDGRDQLGRRRHRASRTRGDDRPVGVHREACGFRLDQGVTSGSGFDGTTFREDVWPDLACNLQKFERELPVAVESFGHELIEAVP